MLFARDDSVFGVNTNSPDTSVPLTAMHINGRLRVKDGIVGGASSWGDLRLNNNVYISEDVAGTGMPGIVNTGSEDIVIGGASKGAYTGGIRFFTNEGGAGTEKMRIQPDGNVGIGTTAPMAELQIGGGSGGTGDLFLSRGSSITTGQALGSIQFRTNDSDETGSVGKIHLNAESDFTSGSADTYMAFHTNKGAANTMAEAMRITSDGYVGIGTTVPIGRLDIQGSTSDPTAFALKVRNSSNVELLSIRNDGVIVPNANLNYGGDFGPRSTSSGSLIQFETGGSSPGGILLDTTPSNGTDKHILLMPGGNVGIGTTAPGAKLDIQGGDLWVQQICDENGANCDDVSDGLGGAEGDLILPWGKYTGVESALPSE